MKTSQSVFFILAILALVAFSGCTTSAYYGGFTPVVLPGAIIMMITIITIVRHHLPGNPGRHINPGMKPKPRPH